MRSFLAFIDRVPSTPLSRGTRGTSSTSYSTAASACSCMSVAAPARRILRPPSRKATLQGESEIDAAWARTEGVRQPTITGASWISWSFASASTLNSAEIHAARAMAREDGVAHVRASDEEALALAFVEVTAAHPFAQGGR